jgi:nitroreductase
VIQGSPKEIRDAGRVLAFTSSIAELVRQRHSCRTYRAEPPAEEARRALEAFLATNLTGPLGGRARFALVTATTEDRAALKGLGTYGFIHGAAGFIVGAVERASKDLEDYGCLMERAILLPISGSAPAGLAARSRRAASRGRSGSPRAS